MSAWVILGFVIFVLAPCAVAAWLFHSIRTEYRRDRVPILLYHRLISKRDAEQGLVRDDEMIWVSYDTTFAEQMRYLKDRGYTTLDLDEYCRIRAGQAPLPSRPVIITFDDGYLSNYTLAFPVLRDLGLKAIIFVAPEPDDYTRSKIEGVDGFLNAGQIREMSDHSISIQSHTLTHCVLAELDDRAATHELTESRAVLSRMTGKPVEHIAIPRAGYSQRIKRLVAATGYRTACGNAKGSANGRTSLLFLPRIVIERDMSIRDFERCLTPRGTAMLRILGNIKRIPEFLGGSSLAGAVRRKLYGGPLRPLFQTRNLKKLILAGGLLYLVGCVLFLRSILR